MKCAIIETASQDEHHNQTRTSNINYIKNFLSI